MSDDGAMDAENAAHGSNTPTNAPISANSANIFASPTPAQLPTLMQALAAAATSPGGTAQAPAVDFTQILLALMASHDALRADLATATTPPRAAPFQRDPASYDINNPPAPPIGRLSSEIKSVSHLEWTGQALKTAPLSEFLPQAERFCAAQHAAHPVIVTASLLLTKDAGAWVSRNFTNERLCSTDWLTFKTELLASSLNDLTAPQRLITDQRFLAQGTSTIKAFCERATSIHNKAQTHNWLYKCPEEFFCEFFRGGLSPEIQSRMRPITGSSTFQDVVAEALRIGTPLENNPVSLPLKIKAGRRGQSRQRLPGNAATARLSSAGPYAFSAAPAASVASPATSAMPAPNYAASSATSTCRSGIAPSKSSRIARRS
jgi:hypothetical protein